MKNYLFAITVTVLSLTSCKEKVTDPTCSDGFLNNGETDVDCGGPNCSDCIDTFFFPTLFANFKDSTTQYQTINVIKVVDTFFVSASMSTSSIYFGVYTTPNWNGTSDTSIIVPNSYRITLGNLNYDKPLFYNGEAIANVAMVVDTGNKRIEGSFFFSTEIESGIDSVHVTNGQFNELLYD
jgi:hypothetical protein